MQLALHGNCGILHMRNTTCMCARVTASHKVIRTHFSLFAHVAPHCFSARHHGPILFRTSTLGPQRVLKVQGHHREQELAARSIPLPRLVLLPRKLHTPEGKEVDVKTLAWRKRNSSLSR